MTWEVKKGERVGLVGGSGSGAPEQFRHWQAAHVARPSHEQSHGSAGASQPASGCGQDGIEAPSCVAPGVNGAGKTTQLQIITGQLQPDGGEVIKARANMKIAHLTQEFDVVPTRTVR